MTGSPNTLLNQVSDGVQNQQLLEKLDMMGNLI